MKFEGPSNQVTKKSAAGRVEQNEVLKRYRVEVYNQETLAWSEIKKDILEIENDAFGEEAFDEEMFKEDFENPESVVVLLRDTSTNRVIGFTYAQPTTSVYPGSYPERKSSDDTAYVADTVIHPEYRGKGFLKILMNNLESELLKRGYTFMERDSADDRTNLKEGEETFADKIKKNNLDKIIAEKRWSSEEYGMQRFFRMRLDKAQN